MTASCGGGGRLFLVDLADPGVRPVAGSWRAVGMADSDTATVDFTDVVVPCTAVIGHPGFYLSRPGFWRGALGVAAVWAGGAQGVADSLWARGADDPHQEAHLGAVGAALWSLEVVLAEAARRVDAGTADTEVLALTVRHLVEAGATEVLERVGRATGAGPLGHDRAHAARVADLTVYLRQSHAEADLAALGRLVVGGRVPGAASPG